MRRFLQLIGTIAFFCAWPAYQIYLRRGPRTRIVLVHKDKILAVKNWVSDGKWSLPGGGLHKNEAMLEGAVRELREETSLKLDPRQLHHLADAKYHSYGLSFDFHVLEATVGSDAVRAQVIEIAEMEWLPPSVFNRHNAGDDLLKAVLVWQASHKG
jgi:8-oxo-dGTP pyrophosphatase MutT (NUDIX family)